MDLLKELEKSVKGKSSKVILAPIPKEELIPLQEFARQVEARGYDAGMALLSAQNSEEREEYIKLLNEDPASQDYQI